MIIKIENTDDKNVQNFYPEEKIKISNVSEFADAKTLRKSPLAEAIFDIGEIESVLIASDMISVKKQENASWEDISPQVMAEILDFMATGAHVIVTNSENEECDIIKKITTLIDARIRPALHKDGGDIEVKCFEDAVLYVELTGKCSGCPYAMRTLKEGVEKILTAYIPQIKEVKPFKEKKI